MSLPTGFGNEGVEEEIDLSGMLTDEQIDRLEAKAERLEKASDRIQRILNETGNAPQDLGNEEVNGPTLPRGTGGFVSFKRGQLVGGGVRGQQDNFSNQPAPFDPKTGTFYTQVTDDLEAQQAAIDLLRAEMQGIGKGQKINFKRINALENQVFKAAREGISAVRDPMGFGIGKITQLAGKYAIPIGAILGIITLSIELIKDQFRPGGLFDVRKIMLDQAREYMFQPDLIDIDRGTIYFATTSSLSQMAPDISNTQAKVSGHLKDVMRNPGQ